GGADYEAALDRTEGEFSRTLLEFQRCFHGAQADPEAALALVVRWPPRKCAQTRGEVRQRLDGSGLVILQCFYSRVGDDSPIPRGCEAGSRDFQLRQASLSRRRRQQGARRKTHSRLVCKALQKCRSRIPRVDLG